MTTRQEFVATASPGPAAEPDDEDDDQGDEPEEGTTGTALKSA